MMSDLQKDTIINQPSVTASLSQAGYRLHQHLSLWQEADTERAVLTRQLVTKHYASSVQQINYSKQ